MSEIIVRSTVKGVGMTFLMLAIFFGVGALTSSWIFALNQFIAYWYFILGLAFGFGIQVGLYAYLKEKASHGSTPDMTVTAISGVTATTSMISCGAHCLAGILPVLGVTSLASLIGQYQIELFWISIIFNIAGIAFIGSRIIQFKQQKNVMGEHLKLFPKGSTLNK